MNALNWFLSIPSVIYIAWVPSFMVLLLLKHIYVTLAFCDAVRSLTFNAMGYAIAFFIRFKLCIAVATHNLKRVKLILCTIWTKIYVNL